MKDKIKIITLGDIFKNIETPEKAFRFKNYMKDLQEENQRLNNVLNELEDKLLQLRLTDVDGKTIVYRMLNYLKELKESDK